MGAKDGGVLAPNQCTTTKCFSKPFGLILGGFFYIGKKKSVFLPKYFFQAINQQIRAVTLPLTQLHGWLKHPKTLRGEKQPTQGPPEDFL